MTFSLAVSSGDLVQNGSQLSIVSGTDKLQQDLILWLIIRLGSNSMHPDWGSALETYIGGLVNSNTQATVYNEIMRVLTNYQALQQSAFIANPQLFSLSELLISVDSVNVSVTYDTAYATIQVSNPASTTTVSVAPSV